jgi:UDP-GlcNAc3NAcA epimerase
MAEEINRVIVDHVSDVLFAPTRAAVENLEHEGLGGSKTHLVGDVMYDAAIVYGKKAQRESRVLQRLVVRPKQYILATIHRAENTDVPFRLRSILEALRAVSLDLPVVFPVHPRTRREVAKQKLERNCGESDLRMIDPVGYLDMVMLEQNAEVIVTDSGGVQKESLFHRVPCVTVRDSTEWVESVELGWNRLVSPENVNEITQAVRDARKSRPQPPSNLYGDGNSAELITRIMLERVSSSGNGPI